MPLSEYQAELQMTLERTGGAVLLDKLDEVSKSDREHSERVGWYAMHVVQAEGGSRKSIISAGVDGSLHDIGKMHPEVQRIISLPRDLTPEERAESNRLHTQLGASMIRALDVDEDERWIIEEAASVAFYHHHTPRQLARLIIPTSMIRRIQIVDRFDALQDEGRPYRTGVSSEAALRDIEALLRDQHAFDGLAASTLEKLKTAPVV